MPINEMRAIATFSKAIELGSIRRAALAQGVSPQAASQTLAQLEQHLGVRLLHRTTRSLALTDEGRHLLEATRPALQALERALLAVRDAKDEIAGPLRIVGPHSSFVPMLMPVLDAFCQRHPGIQPDVQLDDGIGNWVADRVDVGFRIGAVPAEGLVARRLFTVQLLVCAAPAYLQRHGAPKTLDDLAAHRCSAFRHPSTGQVLPWYMAVGGEIVHHHVAPAFSTNDTELELQAVVAGQVLGQLSNMACAAAIRQRALVPVLLQHMSEHMAVHLYYGSRVAQPQRVRAFIDMAVEQLADSTQFVLSKKELLDAAKAGAGRRRAKT